MTDKFHDENVEVLIAKIRARSVAGQKAHGQNTERDDFGVREWTLEAHEELIDLCVYMQAMINKLPPGGCPQCHYLQNKIDRHECRAAIVPNRKWAQYLKNFQLTGHYDRWEWEMGRVFREEAE